MGGFNCMSKIGEGIIEILKELEDSAIEEEILDWVVNGFDIEMIEEKIIKPAKAGEWEANAWHIVEKPATVEDEMKEELFNRLRKYPLKDLEYRIGMVFPEEI